MVMMKVESNGLTMLYMYPPQFLDPFTATPVPGTYVNPKDADRFFAL